MASAKDSSRTNILDTVTMAEPVGPSSGPGAEPLVAPTIKDVASVVGEFLKKQPDVKRVNVTKVAQIDPQSGHWEAEAEVYVPNATIQTLGLPVRKTVLDCQRYLLRVDGRLNIIAYGLRESVEGRA